MLRAVLPAGLLLAGCVPLDPGLCGEDPFADSTAPDERVLVVHPDGSPDAAGTETTPLDRLDTALARLGEAGGTVLLREGRHLGPRTSLELAADVRILGACKEGVTLVADPEAEAPGGGPGRAVAHFDVTGPEGSGPTVELSGLTVEGGEGIQVSGLYAGGLVVRDAAFRGATPALSIAWIRSIRVEDVHISEVAPDEPPEDSAHPAWNAAAVFVDGLSTEQAELVGLTIEDVRGTALAMRGSAADRPVFTFRDLHVRDVRAPGPRGVGAGAVFGNAVGVLEDALIEQVRGLGIDVVGGDVHAEGLTVRDIRLAAPRNSGRGVLLEHGGALLGDDLLIEDTDGPGISMVSRARVELRGPVLRRNGFAAISQLQGVLDLDGGEIADPRVSPEYGGGVGVFLWGDPPYWETTASDFPSSALRGTRISGAPGAGVYVRGWEDPLLLDGIEVTGSAAGVFGGWLEPPKGEPLELRGGHFASLPGDAVLLDGPQRVRIELFTWQDLGGLPLLRQRCDAAKEDAVPLPPDLAEAGACGPIRRETRPMLFFDGRSSESGIQN